MDRQFEIIEDRYKNITEIFSTQILKSMNYKHYNNDGCLQSYVTRVKLPSSMPIKLDKGNPHFRKEERGHVEFSGSENFPDLKIDVSITQVTYWYSYGVKLYIWIPNAEQEFVIHLKINNHNSDKKLKHMVETLSQILEESTYKSNFFNITEEMLENYRATTFKECLVDFLVKKYRTRKENEAIDTSEIVSQLNEDFSYGKIDKLNEAIRLKTIEIGEKIDNQVYQYHHKLTNYPKGSEIELTYNFLINRSKDVLSDHDIYNYFHHNLDKLSGSVLIGKHFRDGRVLIDRDSCKLNYSCKEPFEEIVANLELALSCAKARKLYFYEKIRKGNRADKVFF